MRKYLKKLGQVDQAGAEALIVAYLVSNGRFRSLFTFNIKPHVYVAMRIFKDHWSEILGIKSIDDYIDAPINKLKTMPLWSQLQEIIKSDDDRYYVGKKTCHSSNYDIKAPTFQLSLLLDTDGKLVYSIEQCKAFLNIYRVDLFPEIPEWHLDIQAELNKGRVLKNLFGDARRFHGAWGPDIFKAAYAFKPQSTVGCITHNAILELQDELDNGMHEEWGLDLLQNGHDSILFQFFPEYEMEVCKRITTAMCQELTSPRGEIFRMKSECATGWNWGPMKKETNPDGLVELKLVA